MRVVKATCPHVARAQKAAADLARRCGCVVVVGEEGHPEVEGLVAYAREAGGEVFVVAAPGDLPASIEAPVGIVVQTTQTREALDAVVEAPEELDPSWFVGCESVGVTAGASTPEDQIAAIVERLEAL